MYTRLVRCTTRFRLVLITSRQKSVKRFERSNGLDTALYKNYLYNFGSEYQQQDNTMNRLSCSLVDCLQNSDKSRCHKEGKYAYSDPPNGFI